MGREGNGGKRAGAISASPDYKDYDQNNPDNWYDQGWDQDDPGEDYNQGYQDAQEDYGYDQE
eukprot:2374701-Prorocentrum_lima.AAC.1